MVDTEGRNIILGRHLSPALWPEPPDLGYLSVFHQAFWAFLH